MATTRPYKQIARAAAQEARRWRTLRAAWDLFGQHRYEDVSMQDIAERARVGERTIYRLVGAKEALLDAWIDVLLSRRGVDATRPDPETDVPREVQIGWQRWVDDDGEDREPGNVDSFVEGLMAFYEEWGDGLVLMRAQEDEVPQFRRLLELGRKRHRIWVHHFLGPLLGACDVTQRKRRLVTLEAVCEVTTWRVLRREQGLSERATATTFSDLITALTRDP